MNSWQHMIAEGLAASVPIDEQRSLFGTLILMFLRIDSGFSVACDNDIRRYCETVTFKKGTVIVDFGEVCNHFFFPYIGKVSVQNKLDNKIDTCEFGASFANVIALESFNSQKPSYEKLVVLEDTTCITLHWSHFIAIFRRHIDFKRICCLFNEVNGGPMDNRIKAVDASWAVPAAFPEYPDGVWRSI